MIFPPILASYGDIKQLKEVYSGLKIIDPGLNQNSRIYFYFVKYKNELKNCAKNWSVTLSNQSYFAFAIIDCYLRFVVDCLVYVAATNREMRNALISAGKIQPKPKRSELEKNLIAMVVIFIAVSIFLMVLVSLLAK